MADDDSGLAPVSDTTPPSPAPPAPVTGGGTSAADPPPVTSTPATSDKRQRLQSEVDTAKAAVEAHIKAVTDYRNRQDQALRLHDQAMQDFRDSVAKSHIDAPPARIPLAEATHQQLNDHNQLGWVFPAMIGLGIAIAGMAGGKGNHGTAARFFLGGLLQSYAEGRSRQQKEMRDGWWKQTEAISKENAQRLAEYRATLSDHRFDQQQKMAILSTYANEFKDLNMMGAAERGDLQAAETHLRNQEKALNRYDNEITKTAAALARTTKDPEFNKYLSYISHLYEEKMGHMPSNDQELTDARKLVSWEDWIKYTKKPGGKDQATGEIAGFPKAKKDTQGWPTDEKGQQDMREKIFGGSDEGE